LQSFFADWYQKCCPQVTDELLKKRWAGVEAAGKEFGVDSDLCRIFFGRLSLTSETIQTFRGPFFAADATFPQAKNDLEIKILAGAVIARVLEQTKSRKAVQLALALICADFAGQFKDNPLPELVARAKQFLASQSTSYRNSVIPKETVADTTFASKLSALKQTQASDFAALLAAITAQFEEIQGPLRALKLLSTAHNALAEETNILWWLFGEVSARLNQPCKEVEGQYAVLHLARELADLTTNAAGPVAASAILNRMLSKTKNATKTSTLKTILETQSANEREDLLGVEDATELLDFCPIHFCILDAKQLGAIPGAITNTSTKMNVHLTKLMPLDHWGSQFYNECLLLRHREQ
jgi:hypothetical protein